MKQKRMGLAAGLLFAVLLAFFVVPATDIRAEEEFHKIQKLESGVYYTFDLDGDGSMETFYYTKEEGKKVAFCLNGKIIWKSTKRTDSYVSCAWYFVNLDRYNDASGELIFQAKKKKNQIEEFSLWQYQNKKISSLLSLTEDSEIRNFTLKNILSAGTDGRGWLSIVCATPYELAENDLLKNYKMTLRFQYKKKWNKMKLSSAKMFDISYYGTKRFTATKKLRLRKRAQGTASYQYTVRKGESLRVEKLYPKKHGAAWVKLCNEAGEGGWLYLRGDR